MSVAEDMLKISLEKMDEAKRKLENTPRWRFLKRGFLRDEIRFWRQSSLAYSMQALSTRHQKEK